MKLKALIYKCSKEMWEIKVFGKNIITDGAILQKQLVWKNIVLFYNYSL